MERITETTFIRRTVVCSDNSVGLRLMDEPSRKYILYYDVVQSPLTTEPLEVLVKRFEEKLLLPSIEGRRVAPSESFFIELVERAREYFRYNELVAMKGVVDGQEIFTLAPRAND